MFTLKLLFSDVSSYERTQPNTWAQYFSDILFNFKVTLYKMFRWQGNRAGNIFNTKDGFYTKIHMRILFFDTLVLFPFHVFRCNRTPQYKMYILLQTQVKKIYKTAQPVYHDTNLQVTLHKKATIQHLTTMLATSKNVLFPGHNHLLTEGTDDPTFWISPECQQVKGHQYRWLAGGCDMEIGHV